MTIMGLATELAYRHPTRTVTHRAIHRILGLRPVSAVLRLITGPLDRAALRLSRGRGTASDWIAGLPPLWLTTTGAKTGKPRITPLYGIPIGDDLALMGTRFGYRTTPGWVYNLEADPRAEVTYRGRTLPVTARHATESEAPQIWRMAEGIYPGYRSYGQWASHRRIRVFILELG